VSTPTAGLQTVNHPIQETVDVETLGRVANIGHGSRLPSG
jgi:hypothetical protein